jgi:hypothetical protein
MLNSMRNLLSLRVDFKQVENGRTQASVLGMPAVITTAPTPEQAREQLLDAFREYLLSLIEPGPVSTDTEVEVLALTAEITAGPATDR